MSDRTRLVLWCGCGTQIVGYGFADNANPPTSIEGPWLCLFCAAGADRVRPGQIVQAFTTEPVKPGERWTFPRRGDPASAVVLVDFDQAAREVAASLTSLFGKEPSGA